MPFCVIVSVILCVLSLPLHGKNIFHWRCVIRPDEPFTNPSGVNAFEKFLEEQVKPNDYNAVFFDGAPMSRLHTYDEKAKLRIHQMLAKAKQLQIAIIPGANGQGLPRGLGDGHEEAFSNNATPFKVSGGVALVDSPPVAVKDAGFETPPGQNWKCNGPFQQDFEIKRSGQSSARIINPRQYGQVTQRIPVTPHRTYELSVFMKLSKDVSSTKNIGFIVVAGGLPILKKRGSNRNRINASALGGGWFRHVDSFNSRHHSQVELRIITTEAKAGVQGTFWFDDVAVQEVGLYEIVRRASLPVRVSSAAGKKEYVEGTDYHVGDRKLTIPEGSGISEGEALGVDWYGAATCDTRNASTAFCSEETWHEVGQQIARVDEWFQTPPAQLIKYSEWRTAGWDPACIQPFEIDNVGSGPYMGYVTQRTANMVQVANSNREVIIINDAYDPYHNSRSTYYAVNGGSLGSWSGLSEDLIIYNWNVHNKPKSLEFFAGTNNHSWPRFGVKESRQRQIVAAGSFGEGNWREWLSALDSLEAIGKLPDGSVIGINYQTYRGAYGNVGAMADFFKAAGRWGTGPIQFPEAGIDKATLQLSRGNVSMQVLRPSVNVRSLRFMVPANQGVELAIFDLRGQIVSKVMNERMAAGSYERKIDTSRMAPGVYFVRLAVVGERVSDATRKMVVF